MNKRSVRDLVIVGLMIALLGGAMLNASVVTASPATPGPSVQATLHDNWQGVTNIWSSPSLRAEYSATPHYTLDVTGAGFIPGSTVTMALLDTRSLQVIQRAWVYAGLRFVYDPVSRTMVPNARPGEFEHQTSLQWLPLPVDVRLWCQSTHHLDLHEVTLR